MRPSRHMTALSPVSQCGHAPNSSIQMDVLLTENNKKLTEMCYTWEDYT